MTERIAVIGTAPHAFAGAGTIHASIFSLLARAGHEVVFVAFKPPFRSEELSAAGVVVAIPRIHSDAYPDSDSVQLLAVTSEIVTRARAKAADGLRVVLIGTYLFPFFQAVEHATQLLHAEGIRVTSIAVPAGSDIWQIAMQVPQLARDLLTRAHTHLRVTYSHQFANEIAQWLGDCGRFEVIPPPIDTLTFRPACVDERRAIRHRLGLSEHSFVLLNCSNMRPVKGLQHTVRLARELAARAPFAVTLLLVGPVTHHLCEALGLSPGMQLSVPAVLKLDQLTVHVEGLQKQTRDYHVASDVALNTSFHDSFNLSLAESMACGTPIVTSELVGLREVTEGSACGVFFSYGSREGASPSLARTMLAAQQAHVLGKLLEWGSNEVLRRQFAENACRTIRRGLGESAIVEKWERLFQRCVIPSRPSTAALS